MSQYTVYLPKDVVERLGRDMKVLLKESKEGSREWCQRKCILDNLASSVPLEDYPEVMEWMYKG